MNLQPRVLYAVIVVLVVGCAVLAYQLLQQNETVAVIEEEKEVLTDERDQLTAELEDLKFSYDTLKTENEVMLAEIAEQRKEIDRLIRNVRSGKKSVSSAKKEAETLRSIMKGYVATIDSLNQLNQALMGENETMRSTVATVQQEKLNLLERQQNMEQIITTGKVLSASSVSAQGLRISDSGHQRATDRAGKTDMLKVCFSLTENRIAESGRRELYLQIVAPGGRILPPGNGSSGSTPGGEQVSASRGIDYANQRLDACIFYTPSAALNPGTYKAYILDGDQRIGSGEFVLR